MLRRLEPCWFLKLGLFVTVFLFLSYSSRSKWNSSSSSLCLRSPKTRTSSKSSFSEKNHYEVFLLCVVFMWCRLAIMITTIICVRKTKGIWLYVKMKHIFLWGFIMIFWLLVHFVVKINSSFFVFLYWSCRINIVACKLWFLFSAHKITFIAKIPSFGVKTLIKMDSCGMLYDSSSHLPFSTAPQSVYSTIPPNALHGYKNLSRITAASVNKTTLRIRTERSVANRPLYDESIYCTWG